MFYIPKVPVGCKFRPEVVALFIISFELKSTKISQIAGHPARINSTPLMLTCGASLVQKYPFAQFSVKSLKNLHFTSLKNGASLSHAKRSNLTRSSHETVSLKWLPTIKHK